MTSKWFMSAVADCTIGGSRPHMSQLIDAIDAYGTPNPCCRMRYEGRVAAL